jgi:hypothetical protein
MKLFKNISLSLFALAALALASCDNTTTEPVVTPDDPFENLVLIGETEAIGSGTIVKLYAEEDLFMGYNRLHVVLVDSADTKKNITDADITFFPLMDMGAMKHSCPIENPENKVEDGTNAFVGAAVFIMPTTATGFWTLDIDVTNNLIGKTGKASFNITVIENDEPRLISFISEYDSAKLFVARIDPMNPEIGINDFTLGIYEKVDMMNFPGVEDIVVKSEPWMPSMNHGSPNNVDPVSTGAGIYKGEVNFTMTGYWQVKLDFFTANQDTIMTGKFFDITFQ